MAWTTVALVITGLLLSAFFRQNAQRSFEDQLLAHTYNLIGAIELDSSGQISGQPNLGDPRFLQPSSGWYWSVSKAGEAEPILLHSPSITGEPLVQMPISQVPFDDRFRRRYLVREASGNEVVRLEAQLFFGDGDRIFQVQVAGNSESLETIISEFQNRMWLFFALFGLGTFAATYFVINYGLRPLNRATAALVDVRQGKADDLEGNFPREIEPLANEINALISANKSVTERARTQVGNLAHALKTPLAVILNEVRQPAANTAEKVSEQAQLMQSQIRNYLDRARIAAQKRTLISRTPVEPVVQALANVMKKLSPDIEFVTNITDSEAGRLIFAGEEQDLQEMLGNLFDNAARFAKSTVTATVVSKDTFLEISISDDGPGLSKDQRKVAVERGKRLDETEHGSGLGLSIVTDIADEYGGSLNLSESEPGGLRATVILPKYVSEKTSV